MENLEERFSKVREHLTTNPGAFMDNVKDELAELRSKYLVEKEHRLQFDRLKDFYQRSLIKGNPGMYSRKFNEALEELKKAVNERKNK